MQVISVLSLKGGSGKSTVVQSLSVCSAQRGERTLVIELDPQGTLKNWSRRRKAQEPRVHQTLPQSVGDVIADAREEGYQWAFVDTPGYQASASSTAIDHADLILIPCKIQSMKDFDSAMLTIAETKRANKPAYILMNQVPPNAPKLVRKRQLEMQKHYNLAVLSRYLSRRADFEYCDANGLSAAEYNPNGPAAEETLQLFKLLQSIVLVRSGLEGLAMPGDAERSESASPVVDARSEPREFEA